MELLNILWNYGTQTASYTGTAGNTTGWQFGFDGVYVVATTACFVIAGVLTSRCRQLILQQGTSQSQQT